jgi:hypothetical protein
VSSDVAAARTREQGRKLVHFMPTEGTWQTLCGLWALTPEQQARGPNATHDWITDVRWMDVTCPECLSRMDVPVSPGSEASP